MSAIYQVGRIKKLSPQTQKSIWQNPTTISDFKTKTQQTAKRREPPQTDEGIFEKAQLTLYLTVKHWTLFL